MLKKTVAVLRGGISPQYEISLQTGSSVLRNLGDEYRGIDLLIDKNGRWHRFGTPVSISQALNGVDVVWNALHGTYGEDGTLQRQLKDFGIPFTGSMALSSCLSLNKPFSKKQFILNGIKTPKFVEVRVSENTNNQLFDIFQRFPLPAVIKPSNSGSSLGVSYARSFNDIERGVKKAFSYSPSVLVEEYIDGVEGVIGIIEGYRGEDYYPLSPVEIVSGDTEIFDYDSKYNGRSNLICPPRFSGREVGRVKSLARNIGRTFGLKGYSSIDFVISPEGKIFVLEINALPPIGEDSSFVKALKTGNIEAKEFIKHILSLALERN